MAMEPTDKVKPKGSTRLLSQAELEELSRLTDARLAAIRAEVRRRHPRLAALLDAPTWRERGNGS